MAVYKQKAACKGTVKSKKNQDSVSFLQLTNCKYLNVELNRINFGAPLTAVGLISGGSVRYLHRQQRRLCLRTCLVGLNKETCFLRAPFFPRSNQLQNSTDP